LVHSLDEALRAAGAVPEIVVIGGAGDFPASAAAHEHDSSHARACARRGRRPVPELDPAQVARVRGGTHAADERHQYAFSFVTLQRIGS
jgi:dihydrofolate reductase